MKLIKRWDLRSRPEKPELWYSAVSQFLDDMYRAINRIFPGVPINGEKSENLDGVWLDAQFTAASTNTTFQHRLGRAPVGLIQVEVPLAAGETLAAGQVLFVESSSSTVVLQCTVATKRARVLLF